MKNILKNTQEQQITFIHPELLKGEVFFTNAHRSVFVDMPYTTKRLGRVAYDGEGGRLSVNDWYPVFLKESELSILGRTLLEIRIEHQKNTSRNDGRVAPPT